MVLAGATEWSSNSARPSTIPAGDMIALRAEHRRKQQQMRVYFSRFVDALSWRDTVDLALNQNRHPLTIERREYLTAESIEAHRLCEHFEKELTAFDQALQRLEAKLGGDD